MGAPFKEVDEKAIAEAHKIPESVALYLGHHIRNDLSGILYISQKLRDSSIDHDDLADKLEKRVMEMAKDLSALGI